MRMPQKKVKAIEQKAWEAGFRAGQQQGIDDTRQARASLLADEDLNRIRARTELMKAIGWIAKACSSALWSDRKSAWDHTK